MLQRAAVVAREVVVVVVGSYIVETIKAIHIMRGDTTTCTCGFVLRVIGDYYRTRPERSGPAAMATSDVVGVVHYL